MMLAAGAFSRRRPRVVAESGFPVRSCSRGAFWLAIWIAGDRTRLRRERIAELEQRVRRVEREAERDRRLAAAEERTRIARELHDSVGHAMNVILVEAGAARLLRTAIRRDRVPPSRPSSRSRAARSRRSIASCVTCASTARRTREPTRRSRAA